MPDSKVPRYKRVRGADHVYFSETKRGRIFFVRHPHPRRSWERVGTRLDQAKMRAAQVYALPGGNLEGSPNARLSEVIAEWRKDRAPRLKPQSLEAYERAIRTRIEPTFANHRVRDITPLAISRWLDGMQRLDGRAGELNPGTKRLVLEVLITLLKHAVRMSVIAGVPEVDEKPRQSSGRKRFLTHEEETAILFACGRRDWLRPIIQVTLGQALRLGEAVALEWADVDFAAEKLTVRRSLGKDGIMGLPKGGKEATIDLTPKARDALLRLRGESDGTGYVFRNSLGGIRKPRDVQRGFSEAVARAGLAGTGITFHGLRHTAITRLANHPRIPLVAVRDFARHATLSTTEGYAHSTDDHAATIGEALAV